LLAADLAGDTDLIKAIDEAGALICPNVPPAIGR
jgi:hypothetical protein